MDTKIALKNEIKTLAEKGREARKVIHASAGIDRWYAWAEKRNIGTEARYRMLAYALFRGVPYRVLEKKCQEDESTFKKACLEGQVLSALRAALPEESRAEWTEDRVKAWMAVPIPEVEVAKAAE